MTASDMIRGRAASPPGSLTSSLSLSLSETMSAVLLTSAPTQRTPPTSTTAAVIAPSSAGNCAAATASNYVPRRARPRPTPTLRSRPSGTPSTRPRRRASPQALRRRRPSSSSRSKPARRWARTVRGYLSLPLLCPLISSSLYPSSRHFFFPSRSVRLGKLLTHVALLYPSYSLQGTRRRPCLLQGPQGLSQSERPDQHLRQDGIQGTR